jgi:hypothetical protein
MAMSAESDDGIVYSLYRCTTDTKAGSKDWAIGISPGGELVVRHCAIGGSARRLVIPPKHFREPDTVAERLRREAEQLAQGYKYLGEAVVKRGHLQSIESADVASDEEAAEAAQESEHPPEYQLHWEVIVPMDRARVRDELKWVAEQLSSEAWLGEFAYDPSQNVCRGKRWAPWEIGYSDEGGLTSDDRGGGVILPDQGLMPVLIILHLRSRFPGCIQLAQADNSLIELRLSPDDPIVKVHGLTARQLMDLAGRIALYPGWMRLTKPDDQQIPAGTWL